MGHIENSSFKWKHFLSDVFDVADQTGTVSHQENVNGRELKLSWMQSRKTMVSFQYHLNCQHITDNPGDIELGLM